MQIIPALCILGGKVATFQPGNPESEILPDDPYALVERLSEANVLRIHLVDIDGARREGKHNAGLIGSLSNVCVSQLEIAGGLEDLDYIRSLRFAGADLFVIGSVIYDRPAFLEELIQDDGLQPDTIMISLDMIDGQLTFHGWTKAADQERVTSIIERMTELGFSRVLITDVNRDYQQHGPDYSLFSFLTQSFPQVKFTIAGAINSYDDIERLKKSGVHEVIVGQDFYDTDEKLKRLSDYNKSEGEKWD